MQTGYIILTVVITLLFLTIVYFAAVYLVFTKTIKRHIKGKTAKKIGSGLFKDIENYSRFKTENIQKIKEYEFEKIYITSFDGLKLCGYYYKSSSSSSTTVICVHGYCSSPYSGFSAIGQYYLKKDYNVIMVNNRAHNESEGKYIGFGILDKYDVKAWVNYAINNLNSHNIYLHGVSMGGASVLMAAGMDLSSFVKGVIADCGFTSPYEVIKKQIPRIFKIPAQPISSTLNFFTRSLAKYDLRNSALTAMKKNKIPTVFFHGKEDVFVFPYMSEINYNACTAPYKKLYFIENAGHSGCYMTEPETYIAAIEDLFCYNKEKDAMQKAVN